MTAAKVEGDRELIVSLIAASAVSSRDFRKSGSIMLRVFSMEGREIRYSPTFLLTVLARLLLFDELKSAFAEPENPGVRYSFSLLYRL